LVNQVGKEVKYFGHQIRANIYIKNNSTSVRLLHTHIHALYRLGKHFKVLLRDAVYRVIMLHGRFEIIPAYHSVAAVPDVYFLLCGTPERVIEIYVQPVNLAAFGVNYFYERRLILPVNIIGRKRDFGDGIVRESAQKRVSGTADIAHKFTFSEHLQKFFFKKSHGFSFQKGGARSFERRRSYFSSE